MHWRTLDEPVGYLGKRRDARIAELNDRYSAGRWRFAWTYGEHILTFDEAVMVYEDAYFAHLSGRSDLVDLLTASAADIYDDSPSNIGSGMDYRRQETARTHLQDIAIRRCLVRLGRCFKGDQLIQIRDRAGTHPISLDLSPGHVPFHRPELIRKPANQPGWALPESVEAWYQSNRVIQVQEDTE